MIVGENKCEKKQIVQAWLASSTSARKKQNLSLSLEKKNVKKKLDCQNNFKRSQRFYVEMKGTKLTELHVTSVFFVCQNISNVLVYIVKA